MARVTYVSREVVADEHVTGAEEHVSPSHLSAELASNLQNDKVSATISSVRSRQSNPELLGSSTAPMLLV